jgi:hypothetical protein
VTTTVLPNEEKVSFVIQGPDNYSDEKIASTLSGVHPEYKDLRVEEIDRPSWVKYAFGEADLRPAKKLVVPEAQAEEA